MAMSTTNSHIADAIELQAKYNSAYMVIGKKSAWTDDTNPPDENPDSSAISEIIGYKKLSKFSLARPLAVGETPESVGYPTVTYQGRSWALIPVDKAYQEKAMYIYGEAEITPDDFPSGMFRQIGVHVNLVPKSGVSKQNLLPSEVQDPGLLRFFENRQPQNRTSSVYVQEQFIITTL